MPGLDGWKVLTRLKEDPDLRRIPVVVVSVEPDRRHGLALGAAEVFQKPLHPAEFLSVIRREAAHGSASLVLVHPGPAPDEPLREALAAGGWLVTTVESAPAARAALEQRPGSLILFDLRGSDSAHLDLLAELRADRAFRSVPTVLIAPSAADLDQTPVVTLEGDRLIRDEDSSLPGLADQLLGLVRRHCQ